MDEHFSNIKDILKGAQFRSANSAYGQLVANWDEIVGKKFAGKTELANLDTRNTRLLLYVNVNSSPLVQELLFFKANIIRKIKSTYNLEVADIIIKATKKSQNQKPKQNLLQETYFKKPTTDDLNKIELDQNIVLEIKQSVEKQPTLTQRQKDRMLEVILTDLKTQEWMKANGFPICEKCGAVIIKKNFGDKNICDICNKK